MSSMAPLKKYILPAVLWLAVAISAVAVVFSVQQTRLLFADLEVLRAKNNHLQVEWGRYLLEQSSLGAYSRVEKVALERLAMQPLNPTEVVALRP